MALQEACRFLRRRTSCIKRQHPAPIFLSCPARVERRSRRTTRWPAASSIGSVNRTSHSDAHAFDRRARASRMAGRIGAI